MSFEGRYQLWCVGGHYDEVDVYAYGHNWDGLGYADGPKNICSKKGCGEGIAFKNMVDDTNGDEAGYITPKEIKSTHCECCGTCLETIYKLPVEEMGNKSK